MFSKNVKLTSKVKGVKLGWFSQINKHMALPCNKDTWSLHQNGPFCAQGRYSLGSWFADYIDGGLPVYADDDYNGLLAQLKTARAMDTLLDDVDRLPWGWHCDLVKVQTNWGDRGTKYRLVFCNQQNKDAQKLVFTHNILNTDFFDNNNKLNPLAVHFFNYHYWLQTVFIKDGVKTADTYIKQKSWPWV